MMGYVQDPEPIAVAQLWVLGPRGECLLRTLRDLASCKVIICSGRPICSGRTLNPRLLLELKDYGSLWKGHATQRGRAKENLVEEGTGRGKKGGRERMKTEFHETTATTRKQLKSFSHGNESFPQSI